MLGIFVGLYTWVNDPTYIYDDDYHVLEYPVDGCVVRETSHVISVVEIENGTMVYKTTEKFRGSRIYSKTHPGGGYYSNFYEKNTN
ncbi:hypothetical protein FACS189443_6460 [Planctomycetales bacterium]|nr:hypothetical protein FACS189443_6460 [Planctomycetales bacterium]